MQSALNTLQLTPTALVSCLKTESVDALSTEQARSQPSDNGGRVSFLRFWTVFRVLKLDFPVAV